MNSVSQTNPPVTASPFERYRHIVVEGPIGAGKTSGVANIQVSAARAGL